MPAIVLSFVSSCFRGCIGRGRASTQRLVRQTPCGAQEHCCDPAARVRHTRASRNKTLLCSAEPGLPPPVRNRFSMAVGPLRPCSTRRMRPAVVGQFSTTPNQIVLEGTWSASKSAASRHVPGPLEFSRVRPSAGRSSFANPFSGTWQAENDSTVKTFADRLQRTLEKRMADSWRSGGLAGNWWLKGSPP
jgi:hypothetical protein